MEIVTDGDLSWEIGAPPQTGDDYVAIRPDESDMEPIYRQLLGDSTGTFVDVGAHVGYWSLRMAAFAKQVIAVEPDPDIRQVLKRNLARNSIRNVTVLGIAAWDSKTFLALDNPDGRVHSARTRTVEPEVEVKPGVTYGPFPPGERVRAFPLDALLDPALDIRLIKLDVEGADLHALRGLSETIGRHKPALIIERHDIYGYYRIEELHGLLTSMGYAWSDYTCMSGSRYLLAGALP